MKPIVDRTLTMKAPRVFGADISIRVVIFRTAKSMRTFGNRLCYPRSMNRALGAYVAGSRREKIFGTVLLAKSHMGGGYIAHEVQHAVLDVIFRRKLDRQCVASRTKPGLRVACRTEEAICQIAEELTRQIWRLYYRKVYQK